MVCEHSFEVSLDKRVFIQDDKVINCVISYSNQILSQYDYLDIMLVVRYQFNQDKVLGLLSQEVDIYDSQLH